MNSESYVTFVDPYGVTRTVPIDDDVDAPARISAKIAAVAEMFRTLTESPAL